MTRLDSELFRGLRFLRRLYLSDNEISQVDRGTFSSMTRIGTIDLARNQMKIIDYQMFSGQNYVEVCITIKTLHSIIYINNYHYILLNFIEKVLFDQ